MVVDGQAHATCPTETSQRPAISAGEATARMRRDRDIRRAGVYKPRADRYRHRLAEPDLGPLIDQPSSGSGPGRPVGRRRRDEGARKTAS